MATTSSPVKREDGGSSPSLSASRFRCLLDTKRKAGKETIEECYGRDRFCRMCHNGHYV